MCSLSSVQVLHYRGNTSMMTLLLDSVFILLKFCELRHMMVRPDFDLTFLYDRGDTSMMTLLLDSVFIFLKFYEFPHRKHAP